MADVEKTAPAVEPGPDNDEDIGSIAVYPTKGIYPGLRHADTNDADEALQYFQAHAGDGTVMTPEESRSLLRKIDWNMMPLLCIVYGLNYLDKTTVSYASIMGFKVGDNHMLLSPCFFMSHILISTYSHLLQTH